MEQTAQDNSQNRTSKFLRDLGIYAVGNLGSKIITFMMIPLYTYFVEQPADYGYYDICLTVIFLLMPIITLQLRDGSFRFLLVAKDDVERSKIITMVYRTLMVSIVFTIATVIAINLFTHIAYLWHTLALLIAMSLQEVVSQVVRGLGKNKEFVAIGIISALGIGLFSVLFVAFMGMGIEGIFLANIVARLTSLTIIESRVHTITRFLKRNLDTQETFIKILKYTLPLLPGSLCWWVTGSSDRWFIQEYIGLDSNGVYAIALRFSSILQTLAIIYYQAWQETAILQYDSKDRDSFFSKMFNNYIYILSIVFIAFCFLLKINYNWLVDKQYQGSLWYIYPLALSATLFAVSAFFDMGYQCAKDTKRTLPAILLAATLNVGLNFALVPQWGIRGILTNSIITYLVLVSYRWYDMKRYFKLSFFRRTLLPLTMILLSAVPYYFDCTIWQDLLFLALALGLLLYSCPQGVKDDVGKKVLNKFKGLFHAT